METDQWDQAAVVLVLEPCYYKSGSVSVVSECPKCFEKSWVHHGMSGFKWNDAFPKAWKERVERLEKDTKLKAFREWGAGLCWSCKHLKEATVEYHSWRSCIIGTGPSCTECPKFEPLKKP
jgi:hypothetical protein